MQAPAEDAHYKRWARSHEKLILGDFASLDEAIPEFRAEEGHEDDGASHDTDGERADGKSGTRAAE